MKNYKHIFFDLDRTLWDFESNSVEALKDILNKHNLNNLIIDFESFIDIYKKYNVRLWEQYRDNKIQKSVLRWKRFYLALLEFKIDNIELAKQIGEDYVNISPTKTKLFPYTHEVLQYLSDKYLLYIITNGFEEVQHVKLSNSDLTKYFENVITSESVGVQKPSSEIFSHSLKIANAGKSNSVMIGDDIKTDIGGALNFGIDQIYFNPLKHVVNIKPTFEITSLIELKEIL